MVPGYLGRVLAGADPVGTCFQVEPGLLVTAWHVLAEIGAGEVGASVSVDGLPAGGARAVAAEVLRVDAVHDLAVLRRAEPLPASVVGLTSSDDLPLGVTVTVTGHAVVPDLRHDADPPRWLDAPGTWAGGTMRADSIALGRLTSSDVTRGMSGGPVRLAEGDAVVGVVSERYTSTDGWLTGTVWVARAEEVSLLLAGLSDVTVPVAPLTEAADLVLTVDTTTVWLRGAGEDVSARHGGVRPGLVNALSDVRRRRANFGHRRAESTGEPAPGADAEVSMRRAGELLAESFLPATVSDALGRVLRRADAASMPVLVGIDAGEFAELPWEAVPEPVTRQPLALHRLVTVYRKAGAPAPRAIPGPLRIVVAISAPISGGGPVLDYESELRAVLAAVKGARSGNAQVRIVPFATTAAIRAALDGGAVHVLHISAHGGPGELDLEDDEGTVRSVTAAEFLAEAVPPGEMPPVISLAACYTAATAAGTSFAAELIGHGAAAVIATETSVTDRYATRVFARVYTELAQAARPDVVVAVAQARRVVQDQLALSIDPRDRTMSGLDEWGVVTVLAAGPTLVFDPRAVRPAVPESQPATRTIAGLVARDPGEFVGRRGEQRRLPALLTGGPHAGVVLTGIGGIGKTTLAAEVIRRTLEHESGRLVASLTGATNADAVLAAVAAAVRVPLLANGDAAQVIAVLGAVARPDIPWPDRLELLRQVTLDAVPVLLVLDNFEDNLTGPDDAGIRTVTDPFLADLLATWLGAPGQSRLLITCRYPFTLPRKAESRLLFRPIGPLTAGETLKLVWSLPQLDELDDDQVERIWRMVGGHPRTLEYVDALLAHGAARFADITQRLAGRVHDTLGDTADDWLKQARTLDTALADAVTVAADDILLDQLLTEIRAVPGAEELLGGISVHRKPVGVQAALFQVGEEDPAAEHIPDWRGAQERVLAALATHDFDVAALNDALAVDRLDELPPALVVAITPDLAELTVPPTPPRSTALDLDRIRARLAQSSLLAVEDGTMFVHRWTAGELARRWTTTQAGLEAITTAHRRAADYWQWRVRVWPQDRESALRNLLEARYHLLTASDIDTANTITEGLCRRLHRIGAWDQESALIQDTLRWLPEQHPRQPVWLYQLGILAQERGDYEEADRRYQQSLTIVERLGDQAGMATTYHQLGILAYLRGDYEEADRRYQQSLTIKERLGDQAGMASSYHQLGILAQERGDYEEADRRYQQSLTIEEQLGNQAGMASSYGQLGNLAQERGDYEEADRRYQQSLTIDERLGNQAGMATTYHQLGILAYLRGDYEEADRRYQQSLTIKERLGDQAGMASSYHQLGILAQERGDYEEADRRYQQSLTIKERLGGQAGMAITYHQLGILAYHRGDYEEADRRYQQSLTIQERLGNQAGMATTYHQLGILAYHREDYEKADRRYQQCLTIVERLGDQAGMAITYHQLGILAYHRGDYEEADRRYQQSLTIKERLGNQAGMATTYHQLGILAQERGDYEEADRRYQQSLTIKERLGDQAGMASSHSLLGVLHTDRGKPIEAVPRHLQALALRLALSSPAAAFDLGQLRRLRATLGKRRFDTVVGEHIGEANARNLRALMEDDDKQDGS